MSKVYRWIDIIDGVILNIESDGYLAGRLNALVYWTAKNGVAWEAKNNVAILLIHISVAVDVATFCCGSEATRNLASVVAYVALFGVARQSHSLCAWIVTLECDYTSFS